MSNIVVITAPSAAGKTTLIKKYMANHSNAVFSVSHTTRTKRENEVDGKDYYFIDKEKFEAMISDGEFIEWALVHDNYYGTSFRELEKADDENNILILDIDIQGALYIKEKGIEANYIFITPPSMEILKKRLEDRGTETEESIKLRIWNAKRELEYKDQFDVIIENDDIEEAYKKLEEAINSKL
ncbi:guanylate kinase [Brachyspira hampsonii 30446]|uniref:Guanylate kinase n=1 Tax=Brachyspira hampsonii 30446 TaxID=1289135 RepID=A0A2U4FNC5_9SPIR|nr:guanylate kinase [Brachyspira hampsonii]EKV56643.1 guanylate kinase [Brachyspira hampsonii 30446]MBW5393799.1 guanylate kinase [Brachyspira hampsonii]OEJ17324.1 guanylate kinase [Brachyspira hampsonii]